VLERAVAHEASRRATATDFAAIERTIELLERHLGERPSVMRADAMFHRALVRSCRNETIRAAMQGVARGLSPIRDSYSGGVATDRQTLDVHRRQLEAMRRRDEDALEAILDEHFRMLETQFAKGIGRRWSDLFGARRIDSR
jgi:DNA-binding FadR family transcriptional regulator